MATSPAIKTEPRRDLEWVTDLPGPVSLVRGRIACQQAGNPNRTPQITEIPRANSQTGAWNSAHSIRGIWFAASLRRKGFAQAANAAPVAPPTRSHQQTFPHDLSRQLPGPGSQRFTDGHLLTAFQHAGHEEMREIRACDQQYESNGSPGQQQRWPHATGHLARQRDHVCTNGSVRIRKSLRRLASDRLNLGFRLFHRYARPQARNHFERMIFPSIPKLGIHQGGRHPQVGPFRKCLPLGHDADYAERLGSKPDLLAEDTPIFAELAAPEILADQRHPLFGPFFFIGERTAKQGLNSHRRE